VPISPRDTNGTLSIYEREGQSASVEKIWRWRRGASLPRSVASAGEGTAPTSDPRAILISRSDELRWIGRTGAAL